MCTEIILDFGNANNNGNDDDDDNETDLCILTLRALNWLPEVSLKATASAVCVCAKKHVCVGEYRHWRHLRELRLAN